MKKLTQYLTRGVVELMQWAKKHPLKSLFTIVFFLTLFALGLTLEDDMWLVAVLTALVVGYGIWCFEFTRDARKLVIVALVGVMAMSPRPVQAAPLVIGGLIVLIGGGIIGCKIVKKCRKVAAGRTNAWPEEIGFNVAAGDPSTYACACWYEEYCEEYTGTATPVAFTLNINVESATNATTEIRAQAGSQYVKTWTEFMATEMPAFGLSEPSLPCSQYSRNGHPVDQELTPVSFNHETRTATIGNGGVTVTVYRSADLIAWQTLMTLNVEVGARLEIADASDGGRAFYRVTTKGRAL